MDGLKPRRVQLSRKKGARLPPNTVRVDRHTKWGNPFKVSHDCDRGRATSMFRWWLDARRVGGVDIHPVPPTFEEIKAELAGKNLACWCPLNTPCHADVLLKIANE